jgi:hypothetical protein
MAHNLELLRSIYADWERDDFSHDEWAHPDIELITPEGTDRGTVRGVREMEQAWRGYLSAWQDYRVEAEEYRELDASESSCSCISAGGARRAASRFAS